MCSHHHLKRDFVKNIVSEYSEMGYSPFLQLLRKTPSSSPDPRILPSRLAGVYRIEGGGWEEVMIRGVVGSGKFRLNKFPTKSSLSEAAFCWILLSIYHRGIGSCVSNASVCSTSKPASRLPARFSHIYPTPIPSWNLVEQIHQKRERHQAIYRPSRFS